MSKYIIEGNINFQTELYKFLDEDSDDEENLCQITGLPLTDKYITLECKHKFNYSALYKEIYKQKCIFNTYNINILTKKQLLKFRELSIDYFIKCPYCRNIQFTILPYYNELGLEEIYGINSINEELINYDYCIDYDYDNPTTIQPDINYTFEMYGVYFKFGDCCEKINNFGDSCKSYYSTTIPNTELSYCRYHYKKGLNKYKQTEKIKLQEIKMYLKKEKENKLIENNKLLEALNIERELKGLLKLKRLPKNNKIEKNDINIIKSNITEEILICKAILKTGPNKGNLCGCKKIIDKDNGLCARHRIK
jgi:hypothetical protein